LVIAGAWDTRYPEARELATRLALTDRVRFLGPVNDADLPGLYSAATVFVFPSRYEGFGFPVLEAMACGTPVACSNVSSLPEVGGDAVSYFDPLLPSTIAAQLIRLLESDSLRQKSATEGVARSLEFTWEQAAAATIVLYRSLHM
ncbi:MAG: glycosyltransferase family 4 protein, partial [Caldilinea sp.]|nr:glycosyltransferase family 4 protein [Caldilinea sp.]